jgi:hypothetical protein
MTVPVGVDARGTCNAEIIFGEALTRPATKKERTADYDQKQRGQPVPIGPSLAQASGEGVLRFCIPVSNSQPGQPARSIGYELLRRFLPAKIKAMASRNPLAIRSARNAFRHGTVVSKITFSRACRAPGIPMRFVPCR